MSARERALIASFAAAGLPLVINDPAAGARLCERDVHLANAALQTATARRNQAPCGHPRFLSPLNRNRQAKKLVLTRAYVRSSRFSPP